MKLKVLNIEPYEYSDKAIDIIRKVASYHEADLEEFQRNGDLSSVNALIVRLRMKIDENIISLFPNLKYILSATTGLDHIDLQYAQSKNIEVISLRGETEFLRTIPSTAELTWGLLIALLRNIHNAVTSVVNGKWERDKFRGSQLFNKTIGIVGLGRIGTIIAEYAKAFGMNILYFDPNVDDSKYKRCYSLEELLSMSDIITIHIHLSADTKNLINRENINCIKQNSYIINTSRGAIINEDCIVDAIINGNLAGYAADVINNELCGIENSKIIKAMHRGYNIIITPHIGGASKDAMSASEEYIAQLFYNRINSD